MKAISKDNLSKTLLALKNIILSNVDSKISDSSSKLMDKETYASKDTANAVNVAISANSAKQLDGIETAPVFSVYGIDRDGNRGFYEFPVASDNSGNFTKTLLDVKANTPYSIPLADERKYYDLICQGYKFIEGGQDQISLLKQFDNTQSYNFMYDNNNISFDGGMQIKKIHPLNITTNSDGFFETEVIKKSDYITISSII